MPSSAGRAPGICQVCETDRHAAVIMDFGDYVVSRCRRCGFVYLGGDRDRAGEHGRYRKDQFTDGYLRLFDPEVIAGEQVESLRGILDRAGAPLPGLGDGAPALDIGCARGWFLRGLREAGWPGPLTGVDISREMTDWGREAFGLDLRATPVEDASLPAGGFGLVTMWDVLEHVPDPRAVAARILDLLRPGGWAVIEVPAERTLFRVLSRLAYRATGGRLRRPARRIYHPTHLSYFTAGSLRRLLAGLGAEGITLRTKEAHVTRFGLGRYRWPARAAIRTVSLLDRALGMEAKLLCAFRRPPA